MNLNEKVLALFGLLLLCQLLVINALRPKIEGNKQSKQNHVDTYNNFKEKTDDTEESSVQDKEKEKEWTLQVVEPYKTLIQTSARLAFMQSSLSERLDVDTAMMFLNDTAYMVSKPKVLVKVVKAIAVSLVTILAGVFILPSSVYHSIVNWTHVTELSEKYLVNGVSEKSALNLLVGLSNKTSPYLFGLQDATCRQQVVCYTGYLIASYWPTGSKSVSKFASENLSSYGLKNNKYVKEFLSGFTDGECNSFPKCILGSNAKLKK